MRYFLLKVLFTIICIPALAQIFPEKNYPKGYFRDPLNIPISLAGNFGELRPNHFHMGLDIRTNHRENLPVYAAADGYISHIKVEPAGFGQAVYINHPNGYTTVYGHLNEFFPALAAYVKHQQYQMETWKLFLDLPPTMFPVKKGDLIAYSGNTGGSQAPHVHFEIRSTADDTNKNPMLFSMPIADHTAPVILRLAVYDRTKSIYEQSPKILPARKKGSLYGVLNDIITVNVPKISFAIAAFDTESGTSNRNGIYEADLFEDNKAVIGFQMDNISYDNTRNVNAHIDYKTKALGGPYLQQLFLLYGYVNSIYHQVSGDGVIDLSDGGVHSIRIDAKDPLGNSSTLHCKVQFNPAPTHHSEAAEKIFYPMMLDGLETEDCAFYIGEKCLYDSVHILYSGFPGSSPGVVSRVHTIGATYIPLQDSFLVRIRKNSPLAPEKKNKVVMERFAGGKREVRKVEWQGDWASAHFRDLGNFQLVLDEEPPVIIPIGFHQNGNMSRAGKIVFMVKDNMGSFKNFRAELDGRWLRFTNDKGKSFIYKFDDHFPRGKHTLKISVEDEAGNVTARSFQIAR